jgi:hypothetical protein
VKRWRLSDEELFRIGPNGLEEISDDTLRLRVLALEIPSAAPTDQTPDDGPAQSEGRAQAAA